MHDIKSLTSLINDGKADKALESLYGGKPGSAEKQTNRYIRLLEHFGSLFPGKEAELFSTPGRTEVGGNHTDHNAGRVLAAAVDLDMLAAASRNGDNVIRIESEGFPSVTVNVLDTVRREDELYTSQAVVRGICARLLQLGYKVGGFDACISGGVPKGSGLSSSAAYEVLIVTILNRFYNGGALNNMESAKIARFAENDYFGKPCGLMDQATCAAGGFVTIDFRDSDNPALKKVDFDFASSGYSMVIVDTGGNHADLNDDYASLEREMKAVAGALGGKVLRDFSIEKVLENIAFLRTKVNDRAILRALHFFYDDVRVVSQVAALEQKRFDRFLELVSESGRSSWMLCQNCYSCKCIEEQGIPIGLAVSERILKGKGACRVHGGGFAGTIQAFVPDSLLPGYKRAMQGIFGENSCHELIIRPVGTTVVNIG